MYYEINETTARRAHDNMSMRDYHEGSATAEYRAAVDRAAAELEEVKAQCKTQDQKERAEWYFDKYARQAGRGHQPGQRDRHPLPFRDDLRRWQFPGAQEGKAGGRVGI